MKKGVLYSIGAIVVVVAFFVIFKSGTKDEQGYEIYTITTGDVHKTIDVDAVMRPDIYQNVTAEVPTLIERVEVRVNDSVTVGEELLRLDRDALNAQIRKAQLAVERAELAENQGRRKSSGLDSRDILSLKKATEQARQTLNELYAQAQKTSIKAMIDGVVVEQNARVGEVANGVMMRIIDPRSLRLEALVPEVDIAGVKEGAEVTVFFDAYQDKGVSGYIKTIEVGSVVVQNNTYYKAIIELNLGEEIRLLEGMNAQVDIQTQRREGVMVVDRDVVFRDKDGFYVYVVNAQKKGDNNPEKVYFEEGLVGDKFIEVKSGLRMSQDIVYDKTDK